MSENEKNGKTVISKEEAIILGLWIEFSINEKPGDTFYCMGDYWHEHIGPLQVAEKYLKEKNLIDERGNPNFLKD